MKKKWLIKVIWWIYFVLLFGIVIIKFRGSFSELFAKIESTPFGTNYNLIPFNSIGEQLNHFSEGWARFNLLGNIIPFVPFGFLLPVISENANSLRRVFTAGLGFVLFVEIFQFFTRLGSFDVDDVILNMSGILIGYLLINSKEKNEIRIRLYEEADFERLTEIHDPARKNELSLAGLSEAFVPLSIAAVEEDLFSYEVYVAEYGGIVAGFIAFNEEEIAWLYVDVNYSRKGIGKSLIDFALHRVGTKVSIEVLKGNFPAISLYSSAGFQIVETLTGKMPGNEQFSVTAHVMKMDNRAKM